MIDLMTVKEVANELRCSVQWIYQMSREGRLPVIRIGRSIRIDRAALETMIRSNTIQTKGFTHE